MLFNRLFFAGTLSLLAVIGCACSSNAAKEDPAAPAESPVAETAEPAASPVAEAEAETTAQTEAPASRSGNFAPGEHPTAGAVTLVQEGEQYYLEFAGDFSTDPGPDLFVILHRDPDVIGTTEPPAHAIAEGSYANIAPLESTTGEQRYPIPAEIDPSEFQSVAIWCRQFNATFGAATLQ